MISLERSLPVNPPGTKSPISRDEVWQGLVMKADNALPFVPQMTKCVVTERTDANHFLRDIEFRGDPMSERITLEPGQKVTFERVAGPVMGTIQNFIDEQDGQLFLRFAFQLEPKGMAPGSDEEKEYARTMESAYLGAVDATLNAIRRLHAEKHGIASAPSWVHEFFGDVDAMRMEPFLARFAPNAKVYFGNNPPAEGVEQIKGAIGGLWSSIKGLSHNIKKHWPNGDGVILENAVSYHRMDGRTVTVPCISILERQDGKVSELRVFIDLAPVFAP